MEGDNDRSLSAAAKFSSQRVQCGCPGADAFAGKICRCMFNRTSGSFYVQTCRGFQSLVGAPRYEAEGPMAC